MTLLLVVAVFRGLVGSSGFNVKCRSLRDDVKNRSDEETMPHGVVRQKVVAAAAEVFAVLHDYGRRLEWDTLLSEAYLCDGATHAGLGVVSMCRGRSRLGGFGLQTEYVSFNEPESAAVKLVNRPPFFDTFAATIRHKDLEGGSSLIEYTYTFTARPRWLRFLLHPVMNWSFGRETRRRLRSLAEYVQRAGLDDRQG
jgi:hypothetical protein